MLDWAVQMRHAGELHTACIIRVQYLYYTNEQLIY